MCQENWKFEKKEGNLLVKELKKILFKN